MNKPMRFISVAIAIVAVSLQFTNCSGTQSDLFGAKDMVSTASVQDPTKSAMLQAKNEPPRMECTQDHIQIGGICDASGSEDNYIEYSMSDQAGLPVPWMNGTQQVTVLQEGRCENGRYFLIVPRPPSSFVTTAQSTTQCKSVGCWEEYRVNSRIFVRRKGLRQFELLQAAPVLPIRIQLIIDSKCPAI